MVPMTIGATTASLPEEGERAQLERLAGRFADEVRWRWKFCSRHPVEGADGRPISEHGGWSGILRRVEVGGRRFLLKAWPAMSAVDRLRGNVLEMVGGLNVRHVPLSRRARVRHHVERTEELSDAGLLVPDAYALNNGRVLAIAYLDGFRSLQEIVQGGEPGLDGTLDLIERGARTLRRVHDAGTYHGEPGAGNVLVEEGADEPRVAFIDFETCYADGLSLAERQALDLRYFAHQETARLVRYCGPDDVLEKRSLMERALEAIFPAYGQSPVFDRLARFSRTGPAMFYEAWGTLFLSVEQQGVLQGISDGIVEAVCR